MIHSADHVDKCINKLISYIIMIYTSYLNVLLHYQLLAGINLRIKFFRINTLILNTIL